MSKLCAFVLACLLSVVSPFAARADSDVRDFEAIAYSPNNTVVALGYFRHVSSITTNLSESLALFRGTYVMRFGQLAIIPLDISLPVVDVTSYVSASSVIPTLPSYLNLSAHGSGVGDVEYFPAIAYVIPEGTANSSHTVLAFNPRITFPTGNYDDTKLINIGANRVTFKPQLGIGQRFLKAFTAEVVANLAFHTTNDAFVFPNPMTGALEHSAMKQDPDIVIDAHLGVDLSRTFFLGASYYYLRAGEQRLSELNDTVAAPAISTHSLRFSFAIRLETNTLALLQFSQDIAASNANTPGMFPKAPIERWFGIRLSHVFVEQPEPSVPQPHRELPRAIPKVNPADDEGEAG